MRMQEDISEPSVLNIIRSWYVRNSVGPSSDRIATSYFDTFSRTATRVRAIEASAFITERSSRLREPTSQPLQWNMT